MLQPTFNRRGCGSSHAKCFKPANQFIHLWGGQLFNGIFNLSDTAHV